MDTSSVPAPSTILFALHIVLLHPHVYLAIKHRTFRFFFIFGTGIVLEVAGQIIHTLHQQESFTSYATVFFCAAIHSLWVEVLGMCSQKWEAYERFLIAEVIAISIVGGGAFAAWREHADTGEAIVKAGMGWFAGSIVVLSGALWCCSLQEETHRARNLNRIATFHGWLVSATLCVLIRVCGRLTDWNGRLRCGMVESESESTLDGGIMLLAVLILTVVHPGQLRQAQSWRARRKGNVYQTENGEDKLQDHKEVAG